MITAESGKDNYMTQISKGDVTVYSDSVQGKAGGDNFWPHDLLCAGYASCLNITVRMVLDRMELEYDKVITKIGINKDDPDTSTFFYKVEILGDIDDATKEKVITKALNCPVKKTLSKKIGFEPL
jgi:putative redox protein